MEEEIKSLIRRGFPDKEVDEQTNLSHLALDSFARIEMLMEIEHSIGVIIPEDDILDMETVGDLIATVKRLRK
jgi:acyl carrier protein